MVCVIINNVTFKIAIVSWFVTDIVLLLIMLAGLLRISRHDTSSLGLWRFLWKQVGHWQFFCLGYYHLTAFDVLRVSFGS
jgi:hypothetical protein